MYFEWFRWYVGTVDEKKFTLVARKAQVPRVIVLGVWQSIIEHAATRQDRGSLEGYDFEENAACLEIEPDVVERVYRALEEKEVIVAGRLKNWEKRQPKNEDPTATQRKREQREREKMRAEIAELKAQLSRFETDCHAESQDVTESHDREEKRREEQRREEHKPANNPSQSVPTGTPPADEPNGQAGAGMSRTERALRECVEEKRDYLRETFPDADIDLELEELVAKYRREDIGPDPWLLVIRWFRKLPNGRASPDAPGPGGGGVSLAEQVRESNRQACRDFAGVSDAGCG